MKILMTGSTGFIGKYLVRMLEEAGYDLWHLVRNKKGMIQEVLWDFSGPLPEGVPLCDVIVHLAADVNFTENLEIARYHVNTVSTMKLAAYGNGHLGYFCFASTVGVHGSQYTELGEGTPIHPENHYSLSKYLSEEVVKTFAPHYSILRMGGIYGLDGPSHLGLNKALVNAVHKRIPPTLKGPGQERRNYICVHDVARWITYLIKRYEIMSLYTRTAPIRETLYLGGPEVKTIEWYLGSIVETILPGMKLKKAEGPENRDFIIKTSPAPFPHLTFTEYLRSFVPQR